MVDKRTAREWLEMVKELGQEIKALEIERSILEEEISHIISLKPRDVPDPKRPGGRGSGISNPTEDNAIESMCSKSAQKLKRVNKQIRANENLIECIKQETKYIYDTLKEEKRKKDRMKAVWYRTICLYYFRHLSLGEISGQTMFEISTVKVHKARGIDAIARMLSKNIS